MFTYHDLYGLMQKRLNAMEFCLFDIKSSIYNLTCGNRINPVQHSKYHGCWCLGSFRHQDISNHVINYVE